MTTQLGACSICDAGSDDPASADEAQILSSIISARNCLPVTTTKLPQTNSILATTTLCHATCAEHSPPMQQCCSHASRCQLMMVLPLTGPDDLVSSHSIDAIFSGAVSCIPHIHTADATLRQSAHLHLCTTPQKAKKYTQFAEFFDCFQLRGVFLSHAWMQHPQCFHHRVCAWASVE